MEAGCTALALLRLFLFFFGGVPTHSRASMAWGALKKVPNPPNHVARVVPWLDATDDRRRTSDVRLTWEYIQHLLGELPDTVPRQELSSLRTLRERAEGLAHRKRRDDALNIHHSLCCLAAAHVKLRMLYHSPFWFSL